MPVRSAADAQSPAAPRPHAQRCRFNPPRRRTGAFTQYLRLLSLRAYLASFKPQEGERDLRMNPSTPARESKGSGEEVMRSCSPSEEGCSSRNPGFVETPGWDSRGTPRPISISAQTGEKIGEGMSLRTRGR